MRLSDQMRLLFEKRKNELRLDNKEEKEIPWDYMGRYIMK